MIDEQQTTLDGIPEIVSLSAKVSVKSNLKLRVSPKIRETWFNGKVYYRLDNQPLSVVPIQPLMRPDRTIDWIGILRIGFKLNKLP
jgi:hypothetical protein